MITWENRVNEHNMDAKTNKVREDIILDLTDKEYINLKLLAYKAGFSNAGELLSSFIGDLTGWYHTNGSDERDLANQWYDRAFYQWSVYFRYYLFNNNFDLEEIKTLLEDNDSFEEVYEKYKQEYDGQKIES